VRPHRAPTAASGIDLYWLPLGAGGRVVPRCGRLYERLSAWRQHRRAQPLFHAALEVTRRGTRFVVEMAPAWNDPTHDHGVVQRGPVGLRPLGRFVAFRYEVRCWPDGTIPDLAWAVDGPRRLSADDSAVSALLERIREVPPLTWGRDELGVGEMWNSNSVVAWLLASCGVEADLVPPRGGRAPGWSSGLRLARAEPLVRGGRDIGLCPPTRLRTNVEP
jgi:hypothetical protein